MRTSRWWFRRFAPNHTGDVGPETNMRIADLLFGGTDSLRRSLVHALQTKRGFLRMTEAELDEMCGLGGDGFPTCAEYEEKPDTLTAAVFCRVSIVLGVIFDEAVPVDLSDTALRDKILSDMRSNKGQLAAACGTSNPTPAIMEKIAPVYVMIRALDEIAG